MTNKINGIDLSKYFKNHYDSWGRLYCIEYKGNSLELQNDIKRLQEENEKLKARLKTLDDEVLTIEITPDEFERYKKCKQALEEIRVFSENFCEDKCPFYENEYSEVCNEACLLDNIVNPILKKIDGVLNDRN